jgi:hypothetical protein
VTTPVVQTSTPVRGGAQTITASSSIGTAHFEDGRTAFKEYVVINMGAEEGEMRGYSTYIFAEGDALLLRFSGGWGADGLGGDYEVVSGTGAFEGASGTGRFDSVEADWERALLFEGSFTLEVPGSSGRASARGLHGRRAAPIAGPNLEHFGPAPCPRSTATSFVLATSSSMTAASGRS